MRRVVVIGIMGTVVRGGSYLVRLTGWRRVGMVRVPLITNVLSWFDCSVPGTRGRLQKLFEPWRWQ